MYAADSHNIRQATETDEAALQRLAELDSQRPLTGPALIAEIADGRTIADPFKRTATAQQVLRMRYGALKAHASTPSVPERLRIAFAPFRARTA